ncbi:MAG: N-acetylglucosamine-6-phosphate deacetylase [Pseudomonadota bacterium]
MLLTGAQIYLQDGLKKNTGLLLEEGVISALTTVAKNKNTPVLHFPETFHIVPGFIDLHVHGARGHDVMDGTMTALSAISTTLAAEGTTAFLATTMTAAPTAIEQAVVTVRDFMQMQLKAQGAAILGIHLEGPFIAAAKMGAQPGDKILAPNVELMKKWQLLSGDNVKLVTLAPELPDSHDLIDYLCSQHIVASIGHTNATYAETMTAINAGCTHATHLFNAMRGIHQREPGTVTAALLAANVMVELILDGVHLHPAIVELVLKTKGIENIVLVTDAMRAKCLADGCYELGGQDVTVSKGEARLADGTLAGSVLTMSSALQNMLEFTGCELRDALKMVAENPAKVLGLFDKKGSIAVGKDADIVVLDEELNVVLTVCGGEVVYRSPVHSEICL